MKTSIRTITALIVVNSLVASSFALAAISSEEKVLEARPSSGLKVTIPKQPEGFEKDTRYIGEQRTRSEGDLDYVVCTKAFHDGQRLYTDRAYTLVGVPEKYRSLTYIRTCQDDKSARRNFNLPLEVNTPVMVYVASDDRLKERPAWLSAFRDTGDDFTSNDSHAPRYSIFAKAFPKGRVILGPNNGVMLSCMYLAMIEELQAPFSKPIVFATCDKTEGRAPFKVQFQGSMLSDDRTVAKYQWDFVDGSEKSAEVNPVHTYTKAGSYIARLLLEDSTGEIHQAQVGIEVYPSIIDTYIMAFTDLYERLGSNYPCFALKGIDWAAVGAELLPRAKEVRTNEEFGLLCMELVARLEDSHAYLMEGSAKLPEVLSPQWDPGFACLIDNRGKPVVYYVDRDGPAKKAGVKVGMTVLSVNGESAGKYLEKRMREMRKYSGYSSERYMLYHAAQWLGMQADRGAAVELQMQDVAGKTHSFKVPATLGIRYLPRRPVQVPGTSDTANVSWARLGDDIGYIYVRRIGDDLIDKLDKAVGELKNARAMIIDVRGNNGGGFDSRRSHINFMTDDASEHDRPKFKGPIVLLTDSRCISAGEGWASWFIANKRARVFGEATAGASARKIVYALTNDLYKVRYPVKAYTGFLDRPIERRGLEPDVPVKQNARDLAAGRDTVLGAAKRYLLEKALSLGKG
ncbi:MAG TPA: S41 family peptidase [Sedimentisphaerales bacterium]|nr:S41 family peptidase [Sedimentisphaerales bacterium]